VLHIMRGVCAAVDTAHAQQLIHRDLKPENIFLCRSEIPKVMDFGLAKALEVSSMLTEPGLVAGTPQYMAPEHVRGGEASPDWDLWALAVMAFEMIVGELPFDSLPSRELRVNDLPAAQQALFSRALAPDPLDRPTSAREFLDDLDRVLTCNELQP
jgi:serine/threonine-protein kinase